MLQTKLPWMFFLPTARVPLKFLKTSSTNLVVSEIMVLLWLQGLAKKEINCFYIALVPVLHSSICFLVLQHNRIIGHFLGWKCIFKIATSAYLNVYQKHRSTGSLHKVCFEISHFLFKTATSYTVNRFNSRKQLQYAVTKSSTQTIQK